MLGDLDTPIMYQDLANYTMGPLGTPTMGMPMTGMPITGMPMMGMPNTSYLGGVRMQPIPERDMVELKNKKDNDGNKNLKTAAKILGAILAVGFIPYFAKNIKAAGGILKYTKQQWNKFTNWIKPSTTTP